MVNHPKCAEFMKIQLKAKSSAKSISNVLKKKKNKSHSNFFLAPNIDYRLASCSVMKGSECNGNEWEENEEWESGICLREASFKVGPNVHHQCKLLL